MIRTSQSRDKKDIHISLLIEADQPGPVLREIKKAVRRWNRHNRQQISFTIKYQADTLQCHRKQRHNQDRR